jgi:hypothetical protein
MYAGMVSGLAMLVYFFSHYFVPELFDWLKSIRPYWRRSMEDTRRFLKKRKKVCPPTPPADGVGGSGRS